MEFLNMGLLQILLSSMTLIIIIFGSLINWFEGYLPAFFPQTFRYGKFAYKGKPSTLKVIEVPKSWFKHFYVFGSAYSLFALYVVVDVYLYGAEPSKVIMKYLDFLCGNSRKTDCDVNSVIIALTLLTLQTFRRFYETWFVSVFSTSKINITQYLVGYIHYWATVTIILSESSGFKSGTPIIFTGLNPLQFLGIVVFIFAWIKQYQSAEILANLRKNSTGKTVTIEHKIPKGGLFKYVSSPHLTCEVLIYLSLSFIVWNNKSFKYVFFWVLSNQIETSLLNHWWYKKTFKNYPKERKAFIPLVL